MNDYSRVLVAAVLLLPQLSLASNTANTGNTNTVMNSRWGHASVFLPEPPSLLIQGGRVDPNSAYSYGSAPTSPDTILLPLSNPFPATSPPYTRLSPVTAAPAQAWHCLANLGQVDESSRWQILSFGGDGGWSEWRSNLADSAWIIDYDPERRWVNYTRQAEGWAGQPRRRIHHSCTGPIGGGTVYISGGRAVDGSAFYSEVYAYSPATNTFSQLRSLPSRLSEHSSVLLANGTLLVFGGVLRESNRLLPADVLYSLDTTEEGARWNTLTTGGTASFSPRLAASASLGEDGKIFVFGGTDINRGEAYNDGWLLDPATLQWSPSLPPSVNSGTYGHSASEVGGQIVVVGGYGGDESPAPPGVEVITTNQAGSGTIVPTFSLDTAAGLSNPTPPADGIPPAATGTGLPSPNDSGSQSPGSGDSNDPAGDGSTASIVGTDSPDPNPTNGGNPPGPGDEFDHTSSRQTIIIVAVLFGAAALVIFLVLFFCCLTRKKKEKSNPDRPYNEKGEGAARLMDDETRAGEPEVTDPSRKALAFAALGNGLARAATVIRKVSGGGEGEGYAALGTDAPPKRRSTKRNFGRGIRLVRNSGPLPPLPPLPPRVTSPTSRVNIFDRDDFASSPPAGAGSPSRRNWTPSAHLSRQSAGSSTQFHDLQTNVPSVAWQRQLNTTEEEPSHLQSARNKHLSFYSTTNSAGSRDTVPRDSVDTGSSGRDGREDTAHHGRHRLSDLPLQPLHSSAEESLASSTLISRTSSMQEVDDAIVGSAQIARTSSVALAYGTPRAFRDVELFASPNSGTVTVSPASHMTVHNIPAAAGPWPLRSASSSTVSSESESASLARPPGIVCTSEDNPSVVSLPSVHSMRDLQVIQRENSVNSTEGVIGTASAPRIETQSCAPSTSASFVTATDERRFADDEDDDSEAETGALLAGYARGPVLGLGRPTVLDKPLPQQPPRSPSPTDPFVDTFSIDFGPTPAPAAGLESPMLLRAGLPLARVSSPLSSTFGHKSARSVDESTPTRPPQDAQSSPSPMPRHSLPVAVLSPLGGRPTPSPEVDSADDDDILPVLRRFVSPSSAVTPVVTPTPSPQRSASRRPVREIAASINRRTRASSLHYELEPEGEGGPSGGESPSVLGDTPRRSSLKVVTKSSRKSTPPGYI